MTMTCSSIRSCESRQIPSLSTGFVLNSMILTKTNSWSLFPSSRSLQPPETTKGQWQQQESDSHPGDRCKAEYHKHTDDTLYTSYSMMLDEIIQILDAAVENHTTKQLLWLDFLLLTNSGLGLALERAAKPMLNSGSQPNLLAGSKGYHNQWHRKPLRDQGGHDGHPAPVRHHLWAEISVATVP